MSDVLLQHVRGIVAEAQSRDPALQEICEAIRQRIQHCDWVGFYLVYPEQNQMLILGPFVGEPTEHVKIPFGQGVCGKAATARRTVVVADVGKESAYLACNPCVRSEIVIPLFVEGEVVGELDIDSVTPAAFGAEEQRILEAACRIVEELFAKFLDEGL